MLAVLVVIVKHLRIKPTKELFIYAFCLFVYMVCIDISEVFYAYTKGI